LIINLAAKGPVNGVNLIAIGDSTERISKGDMLKSNPEMASLLFDLVGRVNSLASTVLDMSRWVATGQASLDPLWTWCTLQLSRLTSHIKIVHLKQKKNLCDFCHKKFGTNRVIKKHLEWVHLKLKKENLKCEYCGTIDVLIYSSTWHFENGA
jgi:hypothetical protein